jgi:hypothetical protein
VGRGGADGGVGLDRDPDRDPDPSYASTVSLPARSLPSLLSALLLYLFQHAFNVFAVAMIPWLLELGEKSPRAAALGWLALLTSPVTFVALAHRVGHGVIDLFDRDVRTETSAAVTSVWAGLFAWFAMMFSSMVSAFLLLAIFPPPGEARGLAAFVHEIEDVRPSMGTHAVLWVGVATILYYLERSRLGGRGGVARHP